MSYNINNISEWTADLTTKNSVVQYRVYCLVEANKDKREHENKIIDELGLNDRTGSKYVTLIGDELAVVCYTDNINRIFYIPYAKGKHTYEWFPNFESAVLAAVCLQKTGTTDAVKYAAKILEVPLCER